MKMIIKKESIYYIALSLYIWNATIFTALNWTDSLVRIFITVGRYCKMISVCLLFFFCIWKFRKSFRFSDVVGICAIVVAFISYRTVYDDTFLMTVLYVVCGMGLATEKVLNCYYKNLLLCLTLIMVLFMCGITENKVYLFSYGTGYSLGTGHSNVIAALLLNLTLLWIYTHRQKNKYIILSLCLMESMLIWFITASRTASILLGTFGVVYFLFYSMIKENNKFLVHILRITMVGIICGAIYLVIGGGYEFLLGGISDNNFVMRFLQAKNIYDAYGVSMWGNNIKFVSMSEAAITKEAVVILDNGILRLLLYYGCACFGIFILGLVCLLRNASKRKDFLLIAICLVFLLAGLMEKSVYTLQLNFTLLLITSGMRKKFTGISTGEL